ncbi:NADPH-dependent F420 reductase [Streptomyces solisilvae]|uniref:NADPH-dependent F420 reductase n=1 Tax=Streptomyces malaysiensis TaxID=92644 RepID=UPI00367E78E9
MSRVFIRGTSIRPSYPPSATRSHKRHFNAQLTLSVRVDSKYLGAEAVARLPGRPTARGARTHHLGARTHHLSDSSPVGREHMTQTLGLIGSGMIGGTLARFAVGAGWNVVVSNSRGPETLGELVAGLGERAKAATPAEAAASGDLVVVSIPLFAYTQLPQAELAGKVVIDTLNYYPDRDGRLPELDSDELTSSELLQRHLTGARVVKAFNNITAPHLSSLARPSGAPDRSALPIAGDDAAAKKEAAALLDALGYDAVDIGDLTESWRSSPNTALYCLPYGGEAPSGMSPQELLRWFLETPGAPLPAHRVRQLADEAVRAPAGGALVD